MEPMSREETDTIRRSAPGADPITVFIHIPKTGGTTFTEALRRGFPLDSYQRLSNAYPGGGGFVQRKLAKALERAGNLDEATRLLSGHVPFGIAKYLPDDSRYVTLLRDPVERTLSHYHGMLKRWRTNEENTRQDVPLEDAIGRALICDNLQTRMLSDVPDGQATVTEHLLEQAKANLSNCFLAFGVLERFDESLVLIMQRLGLRPPVVPKRRESERPRGSEVHEDMILVARRFNAFDIELYRWAAERFDRSVAEHELELDLARIRSPEFGELDLRSRARESPPGASPTAERRVKIRKPRKQAQDESGG
jgi:hypothetical protein